MEGEPAESDEDVQEEDKPTVLWEKCIQQSIFVDLSEDESLHLSDLENSFALHLSQAESVASEASIHFSGSAELSDLDVSSSEPSTASSQSERPGETRNQSGVFHMSAQRPNTMQDKLPIKRGREDEGQNTSDEDQDDLPYDGDFGNQYFNQTADSEGERSADERESVHTSPDALHMPEMNQIQIDHLTDHVVSVACNGEEPLTSTKEDANTKQDDNVGPSKQTGFAPSCPADINQVLLQHFTQEELLRPGRLIEAETLPEVSLLESMDDSVLSFHPAHNQSSCSESTVEKSDNSSHHFSFKEEAGWIVHNESIISSSERINSKQDTLDTSAEDVVNPEKTEQDNPAPAVHTRSFTDIKYGQGKVHYPLPDFSKVAPKVKIPKAPSGLVRPFSQGPGTMHRTQSSPGMLDVITRVLEDSVLTPEEPYMFKEEEKQAAPTLVHHLQTEYDKLLAKYAEAENLIDQMRTGTNAQPSSDLMLDLDCEEDHPKNIPGVKGRHIGSLALNLPLSHSSLCLTSDITTCQRFASLPANPLNQPEEGPSDGDRMTAELRDIISQFMQKVELFKLSVTNMSVSTAEQQMMLRSLMEAQDQLERKYISKKEEHRTLEMQNYIGLARNTGAFDPNRMVEGDIFRIGMHIEDIKEIIDRNVCEQISPPHLSSTPTPTRDIQHVMASPVCMASPSPPPSLHEGPSSSFSTAGFLKIENKEDKEREGKEATEVHDGVQQSDELIPDDPLMRNSGHSCDLSRSTQRSLEGLKILAAETEEERSSVFSDVISHSDILAYLDGARSSAGQRLGTPDSCGTLNSVPAVGECDPGDCMSLAVEVSFSSNAPRDSSTHNLSEPPLDSSSSSQRIVSPETDSGFGSSYLNQSASGSFQPNLQTDSAQSQNDGMNSTDSEGSCSNLQTAIHSASLTSQQWTNLSRQPQSCGGAGAVERWVESTTKESSVHLQGE
ncbi:microtubule organization protein AKNA-like isoform X3 [Xyrichtys novacula]|uniref:Microtubule organization protein AKNA-like isoform X3 n=1 Tax=Xyrichtys novacula TaxID=13765 RepID=A0AAV1GFZ9_XYRNO|nr:microtubule organization protein AKNA-like isoform X3 [Xyrichtys novacula]